MTSISNIKHSLRFHISNICIFCKVFVLREVRDRALEVSLANFFTFYIQLFKSIVRLIPRYYCLAHCTTVPSKPKVSILIPHLVICKHIWNNGQPPFTLQNQKCPCQRKDSLFTLHGKKSPCQRSKVGLLASVWAELDPCIVRGRLGLQHGDDDDEADGDNELEILAKHADACCCFLFWWYWC